MTTAAARALLTAVSRERGTGHVYTDAEAAALLGAAQALAQALRRPPPPAETERGPDTAHTPLRLVVLGRAA